MYAENSSVFFITLKDPSVNKSGWATRHNAAMYAPVGFERPIVGMINAIDQYCKNHAKQYGSDLWDDGVLCDGLEQLLLGLRVLLNGNCGRLDCGTIDHWICDLIQKCSEEI